MVKDFRPKKKFNDLNNQVNIRQINSKITMEIMIYLRSYFYVKGIGRLSRRNAKDYSSITQELRPGNIKNNWLTPVSQAQTGCSRIIGFCWIGSYRIWIIIQWTNVNQLEQRYNCCLWYKRALVPYFLQGIITHSSSRVTFC